jgi:hypothetical protein
LQRSQPTPTRLSSLNRRLARSSISTWQQEWLTLRRWYSGFVFLRVSENKCWLFERPSLRWLWKRSSETANLGATSYFFIYTRNISFSFAIHLVSVTP